MQAMVNYFTTVQYCIHKFYHSLLLRIQLLWIQCCTRGDVPILNHDFHKLFLKWTTCPYFSTLFFWSIYKNVHVPVLVLASTKMQLLNIHLSNNHYN